MAGTVGESTPNVDSIHLAVGGSEVEPSQEHQSAISRVKSFISRVKSTFQGWACTAIEHTNSLSRSIREPAPVVTEPPLGESFLRLAKRWTNLSYLLLGITIYSYVVKDMNDGLKFAGNLLLLGFQVPRVGNNTEELAKRMNHFFASMANVTLGNVTEVIISGIASVKCQIEVVRLSLYGSIVTNVLFVFGMSCFWGGIRWSEIAIGGFEANYAAVGLCLTVAYYTSPSAYYYATVLTIGTTAALKGSLTLTHVQAPAALFLYICYVVTAVLTHSHIFSNGDDAVHPGRKVGSWSVQMPAKSVAHLKQHSKIVPGTGTMSNSPNCLETPVETRIVIDRDQLGRSASTLRLRSSRSSNGRAAISESRGDEIDSDQSGRSTEHSMPQSHATGSSSRRSERSEEEPELHWKAALTDMIVAIALIAIVAIPMLDALQNFSEEVKIPTIVVLSIILPYAGNASEHYVALLSAGKDRANAAVNVAIGSANQIALCVTPAVVIFTWILGKPFDLVFNSVEIVGLLYVLVAIAVISYWRLNWLHGVGLLFLLYLIVTMLWLTPADLIPSLPCN